MTNSAVIKAKGRGWVALERVWDPDTHKREILITVATKNVKSDLELHYAIVKERNAQEIQDWMKWFLEENE